VTKIAIATPIGFETGGPEALYQLCHTLRKFGQDAYLVPWEGTENNKPVEIYDLYDAPIDVSLASDTLLVIPEVVPELILKNKKSLIWWLSVDNSPLTSFSQRPDSSALNSGTILHSQKFWEKFDSSDVTNFCQSFYAKNYLKKTFNKECNMLTDYINRENLAPNSDSKKELITFSYKGSQHFDTFKAMLSEFNCVRISDMSKVQTMRALASSQIFIDLGHQPGRDRMPREAALQNALVMLNSAGAGANYQDAPLSTDFKFKVEDADKAVEKIKNTLRQPSVSNDSQQFYREWVESQQEVFEFEVWKLIRLL